MHQTKNPGGREERRAGAGAVAGKLGERGQARDELIRSLSSGVMLVTTETQSSCTRGSTHITSAVLDTSNLGSRGRLWQWGMVPDLGLSHCVPP